MYRSGIYLFIVLITLFFEVTNANYAAVARKYMTDVIPVPSHLKKISAEKRQACTIECAKTTGCFSFAFGFNECIMWDAKYKWEDVSKGVKLMNNNTGYVYFHLNEKPDATEFELVKSKSITYEEAFRDCRKRKQGNLAVFHDQKTWDHASKKFQDLGNTDEIWIGLNGTVNGGVASTGRATSFDLRWADGHVFTFGRYNKFIPQDPNAGPTSCVAFRKDGYSHGPWGWADTSCKDKKFYLCQYAP